MNIDLKVIITQTTSTMNIPEWLCSPQSDDDDDDCHPMHSLPTTSTGTSFDSPRCTENDVAFASDTDSDSALSAHFGSAHDFHARYTVGAKVNSGGFGAVWRLANCATLCVKIMPIDGNANNRQSIFREFEATQIAFEHDLNAVVELFVDDSADCAYLILPFFDGCDLYDVIGDDQYFEKVSTDAMIDIFHRVLLRLYVLHSHKGLVHGDLKPENVMLLNDDTVELIDFGVATSTESHCASKGHFGTQGYIAPELLKHKVFDAKIDVFSLGVLLYNLATQCTLFPSNIDYAAMSTDEYYAYLQRKCECIGDDGIVELLWNCLAFDPNDRMDVEQLLDRYFTEQSMQFEDDSNDDRFSKRPDFESSF